MAHATQSYSAYCEVESRLPKFLDSFYPISYSKYIVFHKAERNMPLECYNYWDLVLEAIKPYLVDEGIHIVQLQHGEEIDTFSKFSDKHLANIGFQQCAYIIKNSNGYLGTSDVFMHMASASDKKNVSLFGDAYPDTEGPCWNKDYRCLSPDFSKTKPFFGRNQDHKRINEIKPERIASEFLSVLLEKNISIGLKSVFMGDNFHNETVEVVPNFFNPTILKSDQPVNIRADLHFDAQAIAGWLNGRKANLFIKPDKSTELSLLKSFKQNINRLNVFIDSDTDIDVIKGIKRTGLPMHLFCKDESQLEEVRLKFIDWIVGLFSLKDKKDLDNSDDIDYTSSKFRSCKTVLSNNEAYPTLYHSMNPNSDSSKIFDDPLFWSDLDHLYIFNTNNA